jgi:hypothetical protein
MDNIEIIDNFLNTDQFQKLYWVMMGDHFPWYYNEYTTHTGDGIKKYTHRFDNDSSFMPMVEPILNKINAFKYYRINANNHHRTRFFNRNTGFHVDHQNCPATAIFYINTCNGYTKFKNGTKVMSVANRILFFHADMQHAGFTCTDEDRRVIININYE